MSKHQLIVVKETHPDGDNHQIPNIHAVYWGFAEDLQITQARVSDIREDELVLRFSSEGGCTGAAVSILDLVNYVARAHPHILAKIIKAPTVN